MLACRDRLMHPKSMQDLLITDAEWPNFQMGASWLIEQFVAFICHFGAKASAG